MWLGRSLFCGQPTLQLISPSLFAFSPSLSPTGAFVSSSDAKFSTFLLEVILLVNCQSSLFFKVFTPFFFSVVFPLSSPIKSFFYVSLTPHFHLVQLLQPTSFCNCSFLGGLFGFLFFWLMSIAFWIKCWHSLSFQVTHTIPHGKEGLYPIKAPKSELIWVFSNYGSL